jgi:hypothetical protein
VGGLELEFCCLAIVVALGRERKEKLEGVSCRISDVCVLHVFL